MTVAKCCNCGWMLRGTRAPVCKNRMCSMFDRPQRATPKQIGKAAEMAAEEREGKRAVAAREQIDAFSAPPTPAPEPPKGKLNGEQLAQKLFTERDSVYQHIKAVALAEVASGASHFNMQAVFDRVRRERPNAEKDSTGYTLNNSMSPYVARRLLAECEELRGIIKIRGQK